MRIVVLAALAATCLAGCSGKPDPNVPGPLRELAEAAGYRIVSATGFRTTGGETTATGLILERESATEGAPQRLRVLNATARQGADGKARIVLLHVGPQPRPQGTEPVDVTLETEPGIPFRTMAVTVLAPGSRERLAVSVADWFKGTPRKGRADVTLAYGNGRTAAYDGGGDFSYDADRKALTLSGLRISGPDGQSASGSARFLAVTSPVLGRLGLSVVGGPADALRAFLGLPLASAELSAKRFHAVIGRGAAKAQRAALLSWLLDSERGTDRDVSVNAVMGYFDGKSGLDATLNASPPLPVGDYPKAGPARREARFLPGEEGPPVPAARAAKAP